MTAKQQLVRDYRKNLKKMDVALPKSLMDRITAEAGREATRRSVGHGRAGGRLRAVCGLDHPWMAHGRPWTSFSGFLGLWHFPENSI